MFETNPNKDVIRRTFDKPFVKRDFDQKKRPLVYFGLPSGHLYDIIEWKEYLDRMVAVERDPDEKRLMIKTAFSERILNNIQILFGDIDDVMITGHDRLGEKPQPENFDIVNLDYIGGLVVKSLSGDSRRVSAIKSLLARQAGTGLDFRLFLTVNVRNRDRGELDENVRTIEKELAVYGWDAKETSEWYLSRGVSHKMKLYVPFLLSNLAIGQRFSLLSYNTVAYEGSEGSNMVHFALKFSFSKQLQGDRLNLLQLVTSPFFTVKTGAVIPLTDHPPAPVRGSAPQPPQLPR